MKNLIKKILKPLFCFLFEKFQIQIGDAAINLIWKKFGDKDLFVAYTRENGKRKILRNFLRDSTSEKDGIDTKDGVETGVYLKVNRTNEYCFMCLQHWLNICALLENAAVYIVCDNMTLKKDILRRIKFHDMGIKFIRSKKEELDNVIGNIATPHWKKATYAQLTTFYHAHQKGFENFWNIDADDTLFALPEEKIAQMLLKVKKYADAEKYVAMSLDMHRSRCHGKHWSFGITYTDAQFDWFCLFENNKDVSWRKNYLTYDYEFNLDWFFTYLLDSGKARLGTFYFENSIFIHHGDFLYNPIGAAVYKFSANRIYFPIILDIYGSSLYGDIPVYKDCIKFECESSMSCSYNFMLSNRDYFSAQECLPRDNMWLA